jgi:transposase-like protein
MDKRVGYSPVELCRLFDISKSTLLRWEEEGTLGPVERDAHGQRCYSHEHLRTISYRQKERLACDRDRALQSGNQGMLAMVEATIAMHDFLVGDPTGLRLLSERPPFPTRMVRLLLQFVLDHHELGDETFCRVLEVVSAQSCAHRTRGG